MKKILLTFMAAIGIAASANAQLALETFDHAGALPTGWAMQSDGHTVSTSLFGGGLPALVTALDANAWYPVSGSSTGFGSASDYQMITTSYFTPAATADRWIMSPSFNVTSPYMVIQWDDNDLGSGEVMNVLASATASTVTGTYTSLYSAPAGNNSSALTTHQVAIGAYNGTAIRVAFRDHTYNNWGMLLDNVQTVIIDSLDLGVTSLNVAPFIQTGTSTPITGILHNFGALTTTSVNLNYNVNGGTPVVTNLTGLSNVLGSDYTYTSGTPWVPATAGTYVVKVWADQINGAGVDQNHANDTFTATINVLDSLQPKRVMIEEFTQASCDPCANAHVNVDTVYANNLSRSVLIRYHVNFPGRDCMDSVTLVPFVNARLSYYAVGGVPDAQVDGAYVYPGAGYLTSSVIASAASYGSPFKIDVNPSFTAATETYSFTATIKSYGNMPTGLKAYAALLVDTLTYAANQSTETIPQTIFPQVAEAMFPNSGGTPLTAFTSGSTQTVSATWVKNHPWGSDRSVWAYDSTLTGKIVVWVEDDVTKYVYQAAYADVATGVLGVNAVTNDKGSMDVYPNPANKTVSVALKLNTSADVKMEVYNMAGQLVYSMPSENRISGTSIVTLDVSNFAAGNYFVKVSVGDEVLTKKLTVTK